MTGPRALTDLTDRELGSSAPAANRHERTARGSSTSGTLTGRAWAMLAVLGVAWALWHAGIGRRALVNPGGWTLQRRFWAAAVHPELSSGFLATTWRDALTTMAYATLGTALSVMIGILGGIAISETWWKREGSGRARPMGTGGRRAGWYANRAAWGIPRGIHEAVWGLYLINILGRDPLVGILAIAIPFGAITAKVYADLIDEHAQGAYAALRAAGSGRVAALSYGVLPQTLPDLVSYTFYRFECSIRSAVILGMIGAGGLGFRLSLSFQALAYREMWTTIYMLVLISAIADRWGSSLRRSPTRRQVRTSIVLGVVLCFASIARLRPDLGRALSPRTRSLVVDLVERSWPPSPPRDGWWGLIERSIDTFQMSLLAIAFASTLAILTAFVAARGGVAPARRATAALARLLLLVTRAIPPPVWALLVLFVLYPGPLPGAVALGVYNFGILGRLCAEVVENTDPTPARALYALGAPPTTVFAYATVPLSLGRFAAYSLYRWEVALRETVIVGVVGAAGLGRLLEQQRAAFDYSGMFATVLALLTLSLVVDAISGAARRSFR